jgi:hypothetical protein
MGTFNHIQQAMKLTQRKLQVLPGAPAAPKIEEDTTALEMTCASSGCVIDFFAARDWLQAGFEKNSPKFELTKPQCRQTHR